MNFKFKKYIIIFLSLILSFNVAAGGIYTSGGSATSVGTLIITPCSTANSVIINAATACSVNLTYSDTLVNSGPGLKVGTGSLGTAGLYIGFQASGKGAIWDTTVTPSTSNHILNSDGTNTIIKSAGSANLSYMLFDSTAGHGPSIVAGTATTDVAALSITRTNNNAVVATGVKITFTDTTSAAGFLPLQILCGVAGTTNCLSVPKEGGLSVVSKIISATAPVIASGFGTSPTIPANNGTAAFTINVGTGGAASSGIITMPAATTAWGCTATPSAGPQAAAVTYSAPTSATAITLTNYTLTTGIALAWTSGTVLNLECHGY